MMLDFAAELPLPLGTLSSWSRGTLHEYLKQDAITFEAAELIWRALLASLRSPTWSEKQTTATCNCARIFLKGISTAKSPEIRNLPLARDEWLSCYRAVHDAWPSAKVKPLMQVLEVLLQIAKKDMPEDELQYVWRTVSLELSAVVLHGAPTRHLKGSLALSAFFLDKNLSYEVYVQSAAESLRQGGEGEVDTPDILKYLINGIFAAFEQHDAQSSAEKCFKALLKAQNASNLHFWWSLVREFVADHVDSVDTIATTIFPVLLEHETSFGLDLVLSKYDCKNHADLLYCLALLQSLRDQERISQHDVLELLSQIISRPESNAVNVIELLLSHADDGVRVRVLRLLVTSKMTNAPISLPVLQHLQGNIPLWFRPGGSHERGELLSIIRRLLIRLRGGSSTLEKNASPLFLDTELFNAHKAFAATLLTSVTAELHSNASYQRHIMALSILKSLFESNIDDCDRSFSQTSNSPDWPFSLCLRQTSMVQDLLKLVSDAYEDVRALSAGILKHLLCNGSNIQSQQFIKQLQSALESLIPGLETDAAQTNRSDQADGLGRYYSLIALTRNFNHGSHGLGTSFVMELLDRLERILTNRPIFGKPGIEPLHSLLLGVMYCVEDATHGLEAQDRVISISTQVWRAVAERLCIDSPETETGEIEDVLEDAGPKDTLSYAWRALRDSSLVLRSILNPQALDSNQFLTILGGIGNLCMEQLISLRHRGAFATVAQTFTICCQRAMDIQGQELTGLRLKWYKEAVAQIDQQANRLTRRSAGLPAMLAAILSPDDPESFRHFINSFIARSQVTALDRTDRLSLPQVHAMNTLREVMINSRFRSAINPHVEDLLTLSAKNLGSDIWAIQNCGLMLYRACILRLQVEADGQVIDSAATESENSYSPMKLAVDLLRHRMTQPLDPGQVVDPFPSHECREALGDVEQKFAALDLISHIRSADQSKYSASAHIIFLLSSPVWLIRERAAEVLAMLVPLEELLGKLNECMESFRPEIKQNTLHGILLLWQQLFNRYIAYASKLKHPAIERVAQTIVSMVSRVGHHRLAPPVWAALLEIANTMSDQLKSTVKNTWLFVDIKDLLEIVEIRGYCLPETALIYNLALRLINAGRHQLPTGSLFSTILESMERDPNVARCTLERLLGQAVVFPAQELLRLCHVMSPETHSDAMPLVIDMVSLSVETSSERWDPETAQQMLSLLKSWSLLRDSRASSLLAQARLVSLLTLTSNEIAKSDKMIVLFHRLEQDISDAARDEMDTHIRLQATKAISAYLPAFPGTGASSFGLLLTLRDLLNDDDEDVRFFAARTASTFLSRGSGSLHSVLAEGANAYAVSIRLELYLHAIVCESAIRPEVFLCRMLGVSAHTSLASYLLESPVDQQMGMIKNESRALFAVERQNLYVDEVREVRFWSSMWATMAKLHPQLLEKVRVVMASWATDGLETISTMLGNIKEVSPLLPNLTHNLDTLLLCLRVVRVAEVCVTLFAQKADGHNSTSQRIRQQLHDLTALSSQCNFIPELTHTISEALEETTEK